MKDIPDRITIVPDDHNTQWVGKLKDGRQYFGTFPFHWESGLQNRREFLAVYIWEPNGEFSEARISKVGTIRSWTLDWFLKEPDPDVQMAKKLKTLGPTTLEPIHVAPVRVQRFGIDFGFFPAAPEGEDECWWMNVLPGDYIAFTPPWDDGSYDT